MAESLDAEGVDGQVARPAGDEVGGDPPDDGPSWKPWAEKPKAWNTPSSVPLGPITGMSSGIRASIPAQARTMVALRMIGNRSQTVRALVVTLAKSRSVRFSSR